MRFRSKDGLAIPHRRYDHGTCSITSQPFQLNVSSMSQDDQAPAVTKENVGWLVSFKIIADIVFLLGTAFVLGLALHDFRQANTYASPSFRPGASRQHARTHCFFFLASPFGERPVNIAYHVTQPAGVQDANNIRLVPRLSQTVVGGRARTFLDQQFLGISGGLQVFIKSPVPSKLYLRRVRRSNLSYLFTTGMIYLSRGYIPIKLPRRRHVLCLRSFRASSIQPIPGIV